MMILKFLKMKAIDYFLKWPENRYFSTYLLGTSWQMNPWAVFWWATYSSTFYTITEYSLRKTETQSYRWHDSDVASKALHVRGGQQESSYCFCRFFNILYSVPLSKVWNPNLLHPKETLTGNLHSTNRGDPRAVTVYARKKRMRQALTFLKKKPNVDFSQSSQVIQLLNYSLYCGKMRGHHFHPQEYLT